MSPPDSVSLKFRSQEDLCAQWTEELRADSGLLKLEWTTIADHHRKAAVIIASIPIERPGHVLELDTIGIPLIDGCATLKHRDPPENGADGSRQGIVCDVIGSKWPIADKAYELFLWFGQPDAFQSHLKHIFSEARRIARRIILIAPGADDKAQALEWHSPTHDQLTLWNGGVVPTTYLQTESGHLYFWDEINTCYPKKLHPGRTRRRTMFSITRQRLESSFRTILRRLLQRANLELHRSPKPVRIITREDAKALIEPVAPINAPNASNFRFLEFVGAEGSGKSTLYREVLRTKQAGDWWVAAHDILFQSPFDLRVGSYSGLPHERLLELAIQRLSSLGYTPERFIYLLNHYGKSLETDIMLRHLVGDGPVLNDEGICKNFCSEIPAIADGSPGLLKSLLHRHAIVHCAGQPAEIIKRIRHRQQHGLLTPIYQTASDDEINDIVKGHMNQAEQLTNLLQSEKIPVLRIDIGQPIHVSVRIVQDFLRTQTMSC